MDPTEIFSRLQGHVLAAGLKRAGIEAELTITADGATIRAVTGMHVGFEERRIVWGTLAVRLGGDTDPQDGRNPGAFTDWIGFSGRGIDWAEAMDRFEKKLADRMKKSVDTGDGTVLDGGRR